MCMLEHAIGVIIMALICGSYALYVRIFDLDKFSYYQIAALFILTTIGFAKDLMEELNEVQENQKYEYEGD